MRDFGQKLNEVNGMLGLFQNYWSTFKIQEGQVEAWAHALKDYSREELWKSLEQFRAEETRVFAPSISELIGRTDTLREIDKRKQADRLALEAPKKSKGDYDSLEEYSFLTSRTVPKKNKDDADHETKKAVRATARKRKELEEKYSSEGLRKVSIALGNGRTGYTWERP
jgi:hypothetical protein